MRRRAVLVLAAAVWCVFALVPARAADGNLVIAALHALDQHYVKSVDDVALLNTAIDALRTATGLDVGELPEVSVGTAEASAAETFLMDFDRAAQAGSESTTDLAYAATRAMLASMHDSHVNFYTPAAFAEFQRNLAGQASYAGTGVFVKSIKGNGGGVVAFVAAVFPGGPAARAGLRRFDRLVSVDGKDVHGMTAGALVPLLRGSADSSVTVTVRRRDRTLRVSMVRQAITIPSVAASWIRPGIVYVRLLGFPNGAGHETRAALRALASHGAVSSVILDLRSNGGGLIQEGRIVAGAFLPAGTVLGFTTERGQPPAALTTLDAPVLPQARMVVLIDDGTASTAELVTAGLRDAHRATLIGEKTAGALGVALRYPLPEGGIEVTVSQVDGPRREQIEGAGIAPDVPVGLTVAQVIRGEDGQLEAALTRLGAGLGATLH